MVYNYQIFSELKTKFSERRVAGFFNDLGWKTRQSGRDEYELCSNFAELELCCDGGRLLLRGDVINNSSNISSIINILKQCSISFRLECYGTNHSLIKEFKWRKEQDSSM